MSCWWKYWSPLEVNPCYAFFWIFFASPDKMFAEIKQPICKQLQHEIAPLSQEKKKRRSKSCTVLNCICDCITLLNIIYICNTFCTCSVLSGCSFAQWRYVTWDARKANFCWGRRAKTSSCLPKSCQVMKTTLQQGWPGISCQQRRQIFQQVKSCFHLSCQPGKDVVFD